MAMYEEIINGLQIFQKYQHIRFFGAGPDMLYAGPEPDVVSEQDMEELEKLGWYPYDTALFSKYA